MTPPAWWPRRPSTARLVSWCAIGYYLAMSGVGVVGLVLQPSPSISRGLGVQVATLVFSGGLTLLGLLGVLARAVDNRTAEARVFAGIIGMTLVHGILLAGQGDGGLQSGLRLIGGTLLGPVYLYLRSQEGPARLVNELRDLTSHEDPPRGR